MLVLYGLGLDRGRVLEAGLLPDHLAVWLQSLGCAKQLSEI